MSLAGLLNQTITLYNRSSYNKFGREVVGAGSSVAARVQRTSKIKLLPAGAQVTIEAVVYIPAGTTVAIDDRVDFDGNKYKVFGRYDAIDGEGTTNHIKLELIKWKETA